MKILYRYLFGESSLFNVRNELNVSGIIQLSHAEFHCWSRVNAGKARSLLPKDSKGRAEGRKALLWVVVLELSVPGQLALLLAGTWGGDTARRKQAVEETAPLTVTGKQRVGGQGLRSPSRARLLTQAPEDPT